MESCGYEVYSPESVKLNQPDYNTMAAEQTFVWLSRFKKILAAMGKTHHLFYLHRMVNLGIDTQSSATGVGGSLYCLHVRTGAMNNNEINQIMHNRLHFYYGEILVSIIIPHIVKIWWEENLASLVICP